MRSGTTWSQQAYLKASNAEADDQFGCSVAVAGDTIVVGAIQESSSATGGQSDNSANSSGATYAFGPDADSDGVGDSSDNCPNDANADQANTDGDALGDACDPDDDSDGVPDATDNCPLVANTAQADNDGDSQGDACDPDDDNDGVNDTATTARDRQPGPGGQRRRRPGRRLRPRRRQRRRQRRHRQLPAPPTPTRPTRRRRHGDACDHDDDNDGKVDGSDACPTIAATTADGCPDKTAPDITITSGPTRKTKDATPTFAFGSTDPTAKFSCAIDDAAPAPCTSPYTPKKLKKGKHTFAVFAIDAADNKSAPATRSFTVKKKKKHHHHHH